MKVAVNALLIALLILPPAFSADNRPHACGAVSLYHLANILGVEVELEQTDDALRRKNGGRSVASFAHLIDCAKDIGLELQGFKLTYEQLKTFDTPVIAHLKTTFADENPSAAVSAVGHFIVVEHTTEKWVRIFDRPQTFLYQAATVVSRDRFLELWTGRTLALSERQQRERQLVLYPSPMLQDYGNGREGVHKILAQFENRGSAPVNIVKISASCNCTTINKHENLIPSRGRIPMEIIWDARTSNRSFFTTIHIQTDVPQRPHTFISLGFIREFSVVFIPETLYLESRGASHLTRIVELQNLNETSVRLQRIESSQEWIQHSLRSNDVIYPWRTVDIKLRFETERMPRGEFNETLTVQYVNGEGATKTIALLISGKVNQTYTLTPNRFFFGRIDSTGENTKTVVLNNLSGTEFYIKNVETDIGTTQVKTQEDGNRYQLQLTLPPFLPTGIVKSEVRVHTNHPRMRLLKVPVFAFVAK